MSPLTAFDEVEAKRAVDAEATGVHQHRHDDESADLKAMLARLLSS